MIDTEKIMKVDAITVRITADDAETIIEEISMMKSDRKKHPTIWNLGRAIAQTLYSDDKNRIPNGMKIKEYKKLYHCNTCTRTFKTKGGRDRHQKYDCPDNPNTEEK